MTEPVKYTIYSLAIGAIPIALTYWMIDRLAS